MVYNIGKKYFSYESRNGKKLVRCPICKDDIPLNQFRLKHAKNVHDVEPLKSCAFCFGLYEYPTKRVDWSHLHICIKKFFKLRKTLIGKEITIRETDVAMNDVETNDNTKNTIKETDVAMNDVETNDYCVKCKDFDTDVERNRNDDYTTVRHDWARFYDPVFEKPNWWNRSRNHFDRKSGLGIEAASIIENFDSYRFYHVCIRVVSWNSFLEKMEELKNEFAILPWWCLCDGPYNRFYEKKSKVKCSGKEISGNGSEVECSGREISGNGSEAKCSLPEIYALEETVKHHRHMILATRFPELITKRWSKISTGKARSHGKFRIPIETRAHLINTIAYLGNRNASCDGRDILNTDSNDDESPGHHYFLNRPIYPHASAAMFSLYEGGLTEFVNSKNRNKDIGDWLSHLELKNVGGNTKYFVPLKTTDIAIRQCRVPGNGVFYLTDDTPVDKLVLMDDLDESRYYLLRNQVRQVKVFQKTKIMIHNEYLMMTENLKKQIRDLKLEIRNMQIDYEKQIGELKSEHEKQIRDFKLEIRKEKEIHGYEKQIGELKRDYEKQIEELKRDYEKQIGELKRDYEKQIRDIKLEIREEKLKRDYEKQIGELKRDYEKQIGELKRDYEKQIEELKRDYEKTN